MDGIEGCRAGNAVEIPPTPLYERGASTVGTLGVVEFPSTAFTKEGLADSALGSGRIVFVEFFDRFGAFSNLLPFHPPRLAGSIEGRLEVEGLRRRAVIVQVF